jgi:hypothetical protein
MKLPQEAPAKAQAAVTPGGTSRSKVEATAKAVPSKVTATPAEPAERPRSARPRRTKAEPGRKSTADSAAPPPTETSGVEIAAARHALRQAQLEALGIDDPGEGPIALRERWTFVPGAPSDSTFLNGGQSCEQCGFTIRSDAPSCPRCGYRHGRSSVMRPAPINGPAPEGGASGAEGTALPETSDRPRSPTVMG